MELLLDADAVIKLQRTGVLELVAQTFSCTIPDEVHREVVVQGKAGGYPDAWMIEETVRRLVTIGQPQEQSDRPVMRVPPGLGPGERGVLSLHAQDAVATMVTDDRAFVGFLARNRITYMVPAGLIVSMVERGVLAVEEGEAVLGRMEPMIREDVYRQGVDDVQKLRGASR